ncbi:MAG: 16S rRNA (guanine(527)-N(7))-methyltransferase RsmG [Alphaproteobacteria bacterium]|nr:16S rRNA (guanine(527)-N(7))-methyltransferase RsmG [Alphaproteobacteria bacterium]
MPAPPEAPLTPEEFAGIAGVSRGTLERLEAYAALLARWQERVNLVGGATLPDLWRRHMLDSAQLRPLAGPGVKTHVDLGSGAGFPGLVLAILLAHEDKRKVATHLVESDRRKCAFLREASRAAQTPVRIHTSRIEALESLGADLVTARALAPLDRLLDLAVPHLAPNGTLAFLKGRGLADELTLAGESWTFRHRTVPSLSAPDSSVLIIEDPQRVRSPGVRRPQNARE